jgi:RNA polymerase subunit RPABC4/transcription elongation factor Spt4
MNDKEICPFCGGELEPYIYMSIPRKRKCTECERFSVDENNQDYPIL